MEAAKAAGVDPETLLVAAEDVASENSDTASQPAGGEIKIFAYHQPYMTVSDTASQPAGGEIKIFAYHQPYMTVKEIRESIGLTAPFIDADLPSVIWLAKHSTSPPPATSKDGEA